MALESPQTALGLLQKESFDIVLTDLKMPGIALLEHVKKVHPEVTVIIMTAYSSDQSAMQAMKLGAYDYLTKPFDTDELLQVLKSAARNQNG